MRKIESAVICGGFWKPRSGSVYSVLNYMVTSNHIHLLVKDTGPNVIAQTAQLIAGRTAPE
jgi:DNA-binding PadR family transcriptional regulator